MERIKITPKPALFAVIGLMLLSGCGAFGPRPTVPPLLVTATPIIESPTLTPAGTDLLGPTQEPPTDTPPAFAALPTSTRTPMPTARPSLTPSFTPTFTESPVPSQKAATALACTTPAQGGFATIYAGLDAAAKTALGCPASAAFPVSSAAVSFDNGRMIWASQLADVPTKVIYAVYNTGVYQRFNDTWTEGVNPENTGEIPPPGRNTPIRGIGKVWHDNPQVKNTLGWAIDTEVGTAGQIQRFDHGEMLYVVSLNQTFVFIGGTNWRSNPTPF